MDETPDHEAYQRAADALDAERPGSAQHRAAVAQLERLAERGSIDAAEAIAEVYSLPGPLRDPSAAYRWYFVALSSQGYSTDFLDLNGTPPHYCGVVGDFRNEAQVSDLVAELGFARVQELDAEIREQLRPRVEAHNHSPERTCGS